MPVTHTAADEAAPASEHLVDSLELWRDADRTAGTDVLVPGSRVLEDHRGVIEHAKGALMLRWLEQQLRHDTPDLAPLPVATRARTVA
jgi:hypothetical protein